MIYSFNKLLFNAYYVPAVSEGGDAKNLTPSLPSWSYMESFNFPLNRWETKVLGGRGIYTQSDSGNTAEVGLEQALPAVRQELPREFSGETSSFWLQV